MKMTSNKSTVSIDSSFAVTAASKTLSFSFKEIPTGKTKLMVKLRKEQGVRLCVKEGFSFDNFNATYPIGIISRIDNATPEHTRIISLSETIENYQGITDGKRHFDVYVLVPYQLLKLYITSLFGLYMSGKFHLIGYSTFEPMMNIRDMCVGDARNVSLAFGCVSMRDFVWVSDDDRNSITTYFSQKDEKGDYVKNKKGAYKWVADSNCGLNDSENFKKLKTHISDIFKCEISIPGKGKPNQVGMLGFSNQNHRRSFSYKKQPNCQMISSYENTACNQLIVLNMKLLRKNTVCYLPIRMGEDNCFQFSLIKNGISCMESGHLLHNSPTVSANASLCRTPKNSQLANYKPRDIDYWKKLFEMGVIEYKDGKFIIYWSPNGSFKKCLKISESLEKKTKKWNDKWNDWKTMYDVWSKQENPIKSNKPKYPCKDSRLEKSMNVWDKKFDISTITSKEIKLDCAGWQNLGELFHALRINEHI